KPRKLIEDLTRLGALIDEGLAAPEGLHVFLRTAGVKPETLREAAEVRRKIEDSQPRIVTPAMPDERIIEIAGKTREFVRASIILAPRHRDGGGVHAQWITAAQRVGQGRGAGAQADPRIARTQVAHPRRDRQSRRAEQGDP